jgi:hypothetical protein
MAQKLCSSLVVVMKAAIIARARVCKCSHESDSMLLEIFDERLQRRSAEEDPMQRGERVHSSSFVWHASVSLPVCAGRWNIQCLSDRLSAP